MNAKNKPRYVLIMEENSAHAELLTEVLDRHFAPVIIHTVDSMEDGLKFLSETPYRPILTDSIIGKKSIAEGLKKIRGKQKNIPVIVITGQGDESLAVKLTKIGATEYLVKTRETLEALPHVLEKYLK